jgi:hypothetical protein
MAQQPNAPIPYAEASKYSNSIQTHILDNAKPGLQKYHGTNTERNAETETQYTNYRNKTHS